MTLRSWCGLKGKMALGDAHPYLALFYLADYPERVIESRKVNVVALYAPLIPAWLPCLCYTSYNSYISNICRM